MSYTPVLGTITDASLLPNTSNANFDVLATSAAVILNSLDGTAVK